MVPPYVGPTLATEARVEFVDHIVPGVAVLVLCVAVLASGRRAATAGSAMFAVGLAVVLAGLWMVATHVPLVAQAAQRQAPVVATVWHTLPGVVVLILGVMWSLRHSTDA